MYDRQYFIFSFVLIKAKEIDGVKIIRFEESLCYVNVENFKYKILKLSTVNPTDILANILKQSKKELNTYKNELKRAQKQKTDIENSSESFRLDNEVKIQILM